MAPRQRCATPQSSSLEDPADEVNAPTPSPIGSVGAAPALAKNVDSELALADMARERHDYFNLVALVSDLQGQTFGSLQLTGRGCIKTHSFPPFLPTQ